MSIKFESLRHWLTSQRTRIHHPCKRDVIVRRWWLVMLLLPCRVIRRQKVTNAARRQLLSELQQRASSFLRRFRCLALSKHVVFYCKCSERGWRRPMTFH